MKKTTSKRKEYPSPYLINLDNLRCFIIGKSPDDIFDTENRYPIFTEDSCKLKGRLSPGSSSRSDTWSYLFGGTPIDTIYSSYMSNFADGKKEKNDYIRDIFDSKGKRGSSSFLESVSEALSKDVNTVALLKCHVSDLICYSDSLVVDNHLILLIDSVYPFEEKPTINPTKGYRSYVCYLLTTLRTRLVRNISSANSIEETAHIFSYLLVVALLRDRFPLRILRSSIDAQYSVEQVFHITAMWNYIQTNLSAAHQLISAQDSFLRELETQALNVEESVVGCNPVQEIHQYYNKCKIELEKAACTLDWTNLEEFCSKHKFNFSSPVVLLLHNLPLHMVSFANEGMQQILQYVDFYENKPEKMVKGLRMLCVGYSSCLSHLRNLICWNLSYLHAEMPSGTDEDFNTFLRFFIHAEISNPLIYSTEDISFLQDAIESEYSQLKAAVRSVLNNSTSIQFPPEFSSSTLAQLLILPEHSQPNIVECVSDSSPANSIINAVVPIFQEFDRYCSLRRKTITFLSSISAETYPIWSKDVDSIKALINRQISLLYNAAHEPPYVLGDSLIENLTLKNIRYAEFQSALNFSKTTLLDFCMSYQWILAALPTRPEKERDFQHILNFSLSGLQDAITYTQQTITYFFSGWENAELHYIQECFSNCSYISLSSIHSWPDSRQKAERCITESLDEMEDGMYSLEAEIRTGKLELLQMRHELENLLASIKE